MDKSKTTQRQVGDLVKLTLPGESPWGEILELTDGIAQIRIDNHLVAADIHGLKYGEVISARATKWPGVWEPISTKVR